MLHMVGTKQNEVSSLGWSKLLCKPSVKESKEQNILFTRNLVCVVTKLKMELNKLVFKKVSILLKFVKPNMMNIFALCNDLEQVAAVFCSTFKSNSAIRMQSHLLLLKTSVHVLGFWLQTSVSNDWNMSKRWSWGAVAPTVHVRALEGNRTASPSVDCSIRLDLQLIRALQRVTPEQCGCSLECRPSPFHWFQLTQINTRLLKRSSACFCPLSSACRERPCFPGRSMLFLSKTINLHQEARNGSESLYLQLQLSMKPQWLGRRSRRTKELCRFLSYSAFMN